MVEITDRKSAEAWLKTQPHQRQVWMSARAAARALPGLGYAVESKTFVDLALVTFRAMLISGAAGTCPAPEMSGLKEADSAADSDSASAAAAYSAAAAAAARSASAAARSAAAAARSAAASAARSAAFSTASAAARSAAFAAYSQDTESEGPWPELWQGATLPEGLARGWQALQDALGQDRKTWGWWLDWYDGLLNGTPKDWRLVYKIALEMTLEDWETGPDHVARRIREIEAEWLTENLPQAEDIAVDDVDGMFVVQTIFKDADAIIDAVFRQIDFALDIALRGGNSSGFNEMCVAYKYLDHTRLNCRDDPNAVHMHIRQARKIILGKLADGSYRDEDGLRALASSLEEHEIQLRADHPVIRDTHDRYVAQRIREMDETKRLALAEGFRGVEEDSKARLREEFGLDAETLEGANSVEAQAEAVKRSGGRSQRMGLLIKNVDGSAGWKFTGIAMRVQKIAELLSGLI